MCCRSPAITWRWWRASCSSCCARCWRWSRPRQRAARSRNGRRSARSIAAAFYLLLSGAEVATQRSFIMTAIVLIGVMADRPALTLRTLAIAAFGVLLLAPQAVVHPSFQMSFAATLALIAAYERGLPWMAAGADSSLGARVALWGGREIVALHAGVAGRRACDHALRRLPFPSARALWRDRQSARHADRLGLGDAHGPARRCSRSRSASTACSGG